MEKTRLIKKLKNIGVVAKGSFVLHSGKISDYYIDLKKAYRDPKVLSLLANMLGKKIPKEATCIAATGHGGIPLSSIISVTKGLPLVLIRETEKNHGTMSTIDGYVPGPRDIVAIVDDVYTTGSSVRSIASLLTENGSKISGAYVAVKRGNHRTTFSLVYLFEEKDLI